MYLEPLTHWLSSRILRWLRGTRTSAAAVRPDGSIELGFSVAYKAVAVLLAVVTTSALAGSTIGFRDEPDTLAVAVAVFVPMWLGGLYGLHDTFGVRLTASSSGLTRASWLREPRTLYWERIDRVSFNEIASWYRFRSNQGWSIRISIYRDGLGTFAQLVTRHVPRSPARSVPPRFFTDVF